MKKIAIIMIALSVGVAGCKMKGVNKNYNDSLLSSVSKGEIDNVKKNLPSYFHEGGDIECTDDYGRTPLNKAVAKGHVDILKYLIKRGANVNAPDAYGITPIMRAADNGYEEIAGILLENGADINAVDQEGKTALKWATFHNQDKMAAYLKAKGAKE